MKEVHNFLGITMPQVNIATVAATDDELTARTVEVHPLHCKHMTTAACSFLNQNFYFASGRGAKYCN